MAKFLVETVVMFRQRYVVEAKEESHALDEVAINTSGAYNENWNEFSQLHIGESIVSSRSLTVQEYLDIFDKDNAYLAKWPVDKKLSLINHINYED